MRKAYHEESLVDWGSIPHWSKEMFLQAQDHILLHKTVSIAELFAGTRDVSVVVHDSHASETGNVHLEGHVRLNIELCLGLLAWVGTWSGAHSEDIEGLVSNFINHY